MSTFSLCAKCKNVLRCPTCQRALVYDNSGVYKCSHCSFRTSITAQCSECGGLEFKNVGLGTQKIEKEIHTLFPGARTARVDHQAMQAHASSQEEIFRAFSDYEIDILVGTQMIAKGWDLPNVGLIGIIDADNMLSLPDFSTNIHAFQTMLQVAGRSNRPRSKWRGEVIIQTYHPQQEIFQLIAKRDLKTYYDRELVDRKMLHLPPFGKIIKLIFQDYDYKKTDIESQRIYELLSQLTDQTNSLIISEPQECYISNIRGRYRKQITIKLEKKQSSPELEKILCFLPSGWIIDVDPISIL
jgi:primosomal protein N' (replication factor Y)